MTADDDFTPDERALAEELRVDLDLLDAEPPEATEPVEPAGRTATPRRTEPVEPAGRTATPRRRPLTFGRRL